jgi:hypothetical protein
MHYISKKSLTYIDEKMREGYDFGLAISATAYKYDIDRDQLRRAYDRRAKIKDIAGNCAVALMMTGFLFSPIFFYFVARA